MQSVRDRVKSKEFINRTLKRKLINRILLYSAKKNKTNPLAEYSVLKPDTSSDSPSAKSKGVRLVSAKAEINHSNPKIGLIKIIGHLAKVINGWRLNENFRIITLSIIKAKLTSYEIVWATARNLPKTAYLELEAHPALKIGNTLAAKQHIIKIIERVISKLPNVEGRENHSNIEIRKIISGLEK